MALTQHYHTRFEEGRFYHIYNRTVDKKPMFKSEENYKFFIKRYAEYLSPVVDTYAYCLLNNHFHLLIQVKDKACLTLLTKSHGKNIHDIVSLQFRKLFQSYAMAFNKQYQRIGTLFQTPFKRTLIDDDNYFTQVVYYIHANPQKHGLCDDFKDWKWSSYKRILQPIASKLKKQEVLNWFGGIERFKQYHSENQKLLSDEKCMLDDQ